MEKTDIEKLRNFTANPFEVLGVSRDAEDETLKETFTALQRGDRPSRHPLELIEEAYSLLKDSRSRNLYRLLSPPPLSSLEELLVLLKPRPKYVGPGIWMTTMKELFEKSKKGDAHERHTGPIPVRKEPDGILWDENFRAAQRN